MWRHVSMREITISTEFHFAAGMRLKTSRNLWLNSQNDCIRFFSETVDGDLFWFLFVQTSAVFLRNSNKPASHSAILNAWVLLRAAQVIRNSGLVSAASHVGIAFHVTKNTANQMVRLLACQNTPLVSRFWRWYNNLDNWIVDFVHRSIL
jgi:hypothetical protein